MALQVTGIIDEKISMSVGMIGGRPSEGEMHAWVGENLPESQFNFYLNIAFFSIGRMKLNFLGSCEANTRSNSFGFL